MIIFFIKGSRFQTKTLNFCIKNNTVSTFDIRIQINILASMES